MAYTQEDRLVSLETPLGTDALLLRGFTGREGISQLFEFQLDLLSEDDAVAADALLAQQVTLTLALPDGTARYLNGFVSRFAQGQSEHRFTRYRAEVVPWLWFLTRTADSRIFQDLAVPDILEKVFKDLGFTDFRNALQRTYAPRDYCVQYRETDFNFVSRLMEQYGIYYFFEHDAEKHTLVLGDDPAAHPANPYQPTAHCEFTAEADDGGEDVISSWHVGSEFRSAKYTVTDFNFETPKTSLLATVSSTNGSGDGTQYEVYDHPGEYEEKTDGEDLAKLRMEEEDAARVDVEATSTCRAMASGYRFDLDGHYRRDLNVTYVVTEVRHAASAGSAYASGEQEVEERYRNQFTCIPYTVPYRPTRLTPKPVVQGVQTAIVVGPSGEEIYSDKYGRVKVQFHWDREGKYDEQSSCWIRVAQNWAGKRWGAMFLPRIGQEVIVDFIEGDPDRPIITGRVYNAEQMPPYALPGEQTKSTIKSYSSKGGGGFNEIRFEDKKGSEQVFLYAQRQQDNRVKEDSLEWVGQDRHLIVAGNQLEEVRGNKHLKVKGDHNEQIDGTQSLKVGMDLQTKIGMKRALDAGMEIHLKAGMNVVIEGGMSVTLKAGAGFVVVGPAGVTISGTPIQMNSGGSAGSGSGSSPEAPQAPKEADTAEPGEMATLPPPPVAPPGPSPQAAALRQAAATGVPFCEKCAEAARQAALARGATPEEADEAAEEAGRAGAEEGKTWVEILLVDEDGNPIADEPYRLELPDGSLRAGRTDSSGSIRVDDIDPGTCDISFPKLHVNERAAEGSDD